VAQPERPSSRQTKVRMDLPRTERAWLAERLVEYRELLA
jgi:hypothetical protein